MCRHCERLVEDVAHKQLVHDFMALAASGVNRKLREDAAKMGLYQQVSADDLDVSITVTAHRTPMILSPESQARLNRLLYRDLTEAFE